MATVAGTLLLLLLALLAIPVGIRCRLHWAEGFSGEVTLEWLWGGVRKTIVLPQPVQPSREPPPPSHTQGRRSSTRRRVPATLPDALRHKPFRDRLLRYLHRIRHALRTEGLFLRVRIGFDDPADTGLLCAIVVPLATLLKGQAMEHISFEPDFFAEGIEVEGGGAVRFVPLTILHHTIALLLSRDFRGGIGTTSRQTAHFGKA